MDIPADSVIMEAKRGQGKPKGVVIKGEEAEIYVLLCNGKRHFGNSECA